jgi:hypothetical protein
MFPFLEVFADMEFGMSVAEGGASKMPEALAGLLREHGLVNGRKAHGRTWAQRSAGRDERLLGKGARSE